MTKQLFTATFHDEKNEVQTDYLADSWHEALTYAQESLLPDLGDGWHLAEICLETFSHDSLMRTGHIADVTAPEYGS